MAETGMSFREVLQNRTFPLKCKEIALSTGGASGCLQDQKLPETAGGYSYRDSGCIGAPTRNRFLYWRTHEDVLELTEESLDVNLSGNHLRVRFQGAPILGEISIHEAHNYVIVLVATMSSVHRLLFAHPNKLSKHDHRLMQGTQQKNAPSILSDASLASARDHTNTYLLTSPPGSVHHITTAAACLTSDGEGLFALPTNTGSILLVKLPPYGIQGVITQHELKQSSVMQRLWLGLVPAAIRGGAQCLQTVMSVVLLPIGQTIFIFSVSYDHKVRMWSTKTHECVMTTEMLDYLPDNIDPSKVPIGGKGHRLCKASGSSTQSLNLAVFMNFADRNQFCIFHPVLSDGVYQLNHVTTAFGANEDLVDFALTPTHLWTIWTSSEGEATARVAPVAPEYLMVEDWLPVFMEPPDRYELDVLPHQDPRQTYLEYIFYPGRFSTYAVVRALKTFRRSLQSAANLDVNVSRDRLMADVSAAVEHEIQVAASEYELAEDEFHQLQLQQWARLYSCCTQYKQVGLKALGLFADPNTGLVLVIRKSCASFVRPTHLIEHLYLTPVNACHLNSASGQIPIGDDEVSCRDVNRLVDCMKVLGECLTPMMELACDQDLYHTQSAEVITKQVIRALLTEASLGEATVAQDLQELEVNLHTIQDLGHAAECLLNLLDLSEGHPETLGGGADMVDTSRQLICSHIFGSKLAAETMSKVLGQIAETALHLSRDLLLLLTLIVSVGEQANVSLSMSEQIRSELMSRVSLVVPQYFVIRWCAQTVVTPVTKTAKEINSRQLEVLDVNESKAVTMAEPEIESGTTLLEQFIRGYGGAEVRAHMAASCLLDDDPSALWSGGLIPACTLLGQLVWPVSADLGFSKFLLVSCQYTRLQEYVRLTRDWCDWNEASRRFMLAFAYLNTEEPYKALDQFVEAVHGVSKDTFLQSLVSENLVNPRHVEVVFVLKVIQLFEFFALPHLAVSLASTAIMIAEDDDPNLPTLWSKVFKHQLELGHNDEAYNALVSNPDPTRRKDCLRQLVVVLCDRGQLQTLVQFPYIDLHDEVVGILEARARAVDLTAHNYYDLLYSFHVFRGNYRKAGSIMYEYGLRLGREVSGLKGLQRQAKCYLAALNALRLVDPCYAWIIQPGPPTRSRGSESDEIETTSSPKHSWDGEEVEEQSERTLEVLELGDLEREYLLVHARLRLLQRDPDPAHTAGPTASAADTVALLVNAGLFDCAVNISRMFKMPLSPIFEGMATRCVKLARASAHFQQGDNDLTAQAWTWLEDNDLGGIGSNADVSSADQAWKLLQTYLEKHEDKATRHHKAVALRLLCEGFALPNWFIASYKRLNAAELLRLYLDFDLLQEAAHLTLEYLDAVLGCGAEYFGLKACLSFSSPSVWLPYTCIDQLMMCLRESECKATYTQLYDKLDKKLRHYHDTVESISKDVVLAAQQRAKMAHPGRRGLELMES